MPSSSHLQQATKLSFSNAMITTYLLFCQQQNRSSLAKTIDELQFILHK